MLAASTTGATAGGRLPDKIDSLIERVAVYAGGVLISNGFNQYNVLCHAKDVLYSNKCSSVTGHPECVRTVSYVDGGGDGALSSLGFVCSFKKSFGLQKNLAKFAQIQGFEL